jgi:cyanophycinase
VVGIVPTANENPPRSLKIWGEVFSKVGLVIVPLDIRAREDSSKPAMLEDAKGCAGFWFTGGDQVRIADKIVGPPLQKLIQDKYRDGAVVGGSSAGAAMMSRIMLEGEDRFGKLSLAEFGPGAYRTREGMSFLPDHVIVDQHFLRRGRQNRLFSLVMEHPDHLAIGIDEDTALVVKDGKATVAGARAVMVFDPQGMALQGDTFRNLTIHLLRAGQGIDLATRKLLP